MHAVLSRPDLISSEVAGDGPLRAAPLLGHVKRLAALPPPTHTRARAAMAETVTKKLAEMEEEDKTTLDLSWCKLDDSCVAALIEGLPKSAATQVWLNNNDLSDAGVAELAAGLPGTKVTKLWMNGNKRVTDDGLKSIAEMLPKTEIDEFWCIVGGYGDEGVRSIAAVLPESSLETLWLWASSVGDAGVTELVANLPKCEIFECGLGGNSVTDHGITKIAEYLEGQSAEGVNKLKELYIRWNSDCDKGLAALGPALLETELEKLCLENMAITDDGLHNLMENVEKSTIGKICVNGNWEDAMEGGGGDEGGSSWRVGTRDFGGGGSEPAESPD
jgi:hypothetical protein